jgi:hypothetical protein
MNSLRVTFVLASLLILSASPLSAQASKVSCKDGTQPKVGHFSCWGHGGLVTGAVKPAAKTEAKPASKVAKKDHAARKVKKTAGKKAHATAAKAEKKKTHAKKASKNGKKKQHHTVHQTA